MAGSFSCPDQDQRVWSKCVADATEAIAAEPNVDESFDRVLVPECTEVTQAEKSIDNGTG